MNGKVDSVSGQVQSLNDSVDELKARVAKLDKTLQDMQAQLQTMQAPPQPQAQPVAPRELCRGSRLVWPINSGVLAARTGAPKSRQWPSRRHRSKRPYQAGIRDFSAGKNDVASGEFQDVVHYYPLDDSAGTAQFYLGEIAYQKQDYAAAIKDYNFGPRRIQRERQGFCGATAQRTCAAGRK